jgi:2,3-bisphosphoglycerate-independent phosphoglycerate mutase
MGLVSDGGVHGHIDHTLAAVEAITGLGVPVVLHAITDGRDVSPKSGAGFLRRLEAALPETARIGTVTGRYYAMDRDTRWDRIESAYRAIVEGKGAQGGALSPADIVESYYDQDLTDEFLPATVVGDYAGSCAPSATPILPNSTSRTDPNWPAFWAWWIIPPTTAPS